MSIIPDLVKQDELLLANSLISTTGMIAAGIGLGIGGILVDKIGPKGGFYIDAVSFFISAILIFLIVRKIHLPRYKLSNISKEIVEVIQKSVATEIKEGLLYLFKLKNVREVVILWFILWAGLGSVYIVAIVFVQEMLKSMTGALGILATCLCAGLFFGSMLYGRFGHNISTYKAIFVSLISGGITLGLFATAISLYPSFPLAIILSSILGITLAPITIAANTLIHKCVDENMLGRSFASLEIFGHLAFVIFMLLAAKLAEFIPDLNILITVSVIFCLIGIIGLIKNWKVKYA
jgi:MFS family permease